MQSHQGTIVWSERTSRSWWTLFRLYRFVLWSDYDPIWVTQKFCLPERSSLRVIENDPNKDGNLDNLFETNFSAAQEYCQRKNLKFDFKLEFLMKTACICFKQSKYRCIWRTNFILKSIKIKTWFTKDEVLKFTNNLLGRLQNKNYSFKIFHATDIRS